MYFEILFSRDIILCKEVNFEQASILSWWKTTWNNI